MRINPDVLRNWRQRIRTFGLLNSFRLFFFQHREGEFSLRISGKPFFIRGRSVDFDVLNSIFGKGEYDIEPGFVPQVIVDAGANIGASTLYFRKRFPGARILAIEPEPSNFAILCRNMEGYSNISCINAALWACDGWLSLQNPSAEHYAYRYDVSDGPEGLTKCVSPETLMMESGIEVIDIFKMDIEGAEDQLFRSDKIVWMHRVRMLIVELHEQFNPGVTRLFMKVAGAVPSRISVSGENTIMINTDLVAPEVKQA